MTEEKFAAYLAIQNSGLTNMFDVRTVVELSDGVLSRDDCLDIMQNYMAYENKWGRI